MEKTSQSDLQEKLSQLLGCITKFHMISSLQDFKTYVDQACRAADEFVNIYYETMDKRRRVCSCFGNS